MTSRSLVGSLSSAVLAVLVTTSVARADAACILEAKVELRDCKTTCNEDAQVAKDACSNRDHACMEVCRAKREECRLATGIDDAFAACQATLDQAKQNCRNTHPAGSSELDACIDQAQVVAFQCRDSAREKARPALRACRAAFRECATSCPPAGPSAPPIDVTACRIQAKQDYRACKASCTEDFQVAKDACRNRDHACVEGCRSARETCDDPIRTRLDAAVAQCNAARDVAIQNCGDAFSPGSPELDQCIDNAQVDAFRCRDAAREQARPGFAGCRTNFINCVRGCPPASS
jgi:hypothetical protein